MAYKRKRSSSKRPTKRARFTRRRRTLGKRRSMKFDPFPHTKTVKMRYSGHNAIDPATGLSATQVIRCNSIFDPDQTQTGHQPYGHDQWAAVYDHYEVVASYITARFTQVTGTSGAQTPFIVGIAIKDDLAFEQQFDTIREVKDSKYKILTSGTTSSLAIVKHKWSKAKFFPRTEGALATSAVFGANPDEQSYFVCYVTGCNETDNPPAVNIVFDVTYIVRMWEPKDLGQS